MSRGNLVRFVHDFYPALGLHVVTCPVLHFRVAALDGDEAERIARSKVDGICDRILRAKPWLRVDTSKE